MSEEKLSEEKERKFRERSLIESIEGQIKRARRIRSSLAEAVERAKAAMSADDYAYVQRTISDVAEMLKKMEHELLYAQMLCWDLMNVRGDE